ncbi:ABC transporter ATP-binding protein [Chloroflexota bacterium]
MSNDNEATVIVNGLVKQFKSDSIIVPAIDGISFSLPRGEMLALKGPSGCGKTTLLNLLGALDKPTAGNITVNGINVSGIRGRQEVEYRLRKVGFVFQSYYLIPNLTAIENVMLPLELLGVRGKGQEITARRLLERVGIDVSRQTRRPTRLSGGEQQRVAIARALANDPSLILADEPTGNLDSRTGKRIIDLLHSLTKDGKTIIIATHDADIASLADKVMEMIDGKIAGSPASNGE